jgi:hypothetical protein
MNSSPVPVPFSLLSLPSAAAVMRMTADENEIHLTQRLARGYTFNIY